jgi:nitrate reductase alpha subunit
MNGTSFFYAHTSQWRHEKLAIDEILAPTADKSKVSHMSMIDLNAKSERLGWLPSCPQLETNPLDVCDAAAAAGVEPAEYLKQSLKSGHVNMSCDDPDNPKNFRAICLSGARIFWEVQAKAMSIS